MEALFLYLDEELTNKRPGRIPGNYTVEDLAFWLQFYSLFYDSVFVPANFLTDSNLVPAILERLDVSNPTATLHAEDGPFKILWDTSRFPCDSFKELVHFLKTDESYVSLRDNELSSITAELCDKYLKHRIIRADMTAHLDPLESVEQLRNEVFNPSRNWALEQHILERLAECLEKIVDRREQVGYGRNFYYTLFGYGRTTEQQQLAQKFADIIGKYESLKHEFLTGVDYVSHRLKARFASRAINRPIEVLMPPEFLSIICRPDKAATLATGLGRTDRVKLSAEEKYQRLIVRETITGMSASQLAELHKSREYQEYRDTWHELRKQFYDPEDQRGGEDLEQALNTYLDRITTTLNPKRHYADRTTSMVVKRIPTLAGLSVTLVLEFLGSIAGSPKLSDSARELVSEGVELFSTYAGSTVVKMTTGRRSLPFHSFQLAEDITVYLGKN